MKKKETYIEVAIALPVDKTFTYVLPEHLRELAAIGKRALVPFGRRKVSGYILKVTLTAAIDDPKPILDIIDHQQLFPPGMVRLFEWMADYYFFPLGLVIKNALPGGLNTRERAALSITPDGREALNNEILAPLERLVLSRLSTAPASIGELAKSIPKGSPQTVLQHLLKRRWITSVRTLKKDRVRAKMERVASLVEANLPDKKLSPARQKIIARLREDASIPIHALKKDYPNAPDLIRKMAAAGYVSIAQKRVYRDPFGEPIQSKAPPTLTGEQTTAVDTIGKAVGNGFTTFLLAGVTGSGKTEVYLRLAQSTLSQGQAVLVLVPEISLISQMERRFRSRFGDRVAVLHSGLSAGEKLDQWQKIMNREFQIAIGARSAVFAPFDRIGLIIVDEEHDTSYKQEGDLRYNARDIAVVRAQQQNAVALLGSATPSVQSFHNTFEGKYELVNLTQRVERQKLPEITIIDLCRSRDQKGWRRYFSKALLDALGETMRRNEQAILFLNRRGFANFPVCASCGKAIQCKNCDITLTFHQKYNAYKCHYCGFAISSTSPCPSCGSTKIHHLGVGTEKIESAVKELFPDKIVQRMDRDTTTRKGAVVKMLKGLKNREIDILVGTQMVTKGHDFPDITLVGIICADLSLSFPDFRAGERTFQLLAQVAGRAGRGKIPGRVILQTYNPDHFSIQCAQHQDFRAFYQKEITSRKALDYPPFSRMVQIKISSRDRSKGSRQAEMMGDLARDIVKANPLFGKTIRIFGPLESPLPRIADRYRWQMLFKGLRLSPLREFMQQLLFSSHADRSRRDVTIAVDVDPFFMM
ncbi:MAG: primosomal protein N' [Thermodesulfobacteriota bacterium]